MRYLHTMLRVRDLDQSLDFYCNKLGLKESFRREDPKGRGGVGGTDIAKTGAGESHVQNQGFGAGLLSGGRRWGAQHAH